MPTYEYACRKCGEHLEVQQSFTDASLTECPACSGPLRKVFGNIAITFKGSGFYKTDSRNSSSASKSDKAEKADAKNGDSKSSDSKSGDSGTKVAETKSDSKPAAESKPAAVKPAAQKAAS